MRASTQKLSISNSWLMTNATWKLPSMGIIMYRMRVNASGGSETKITIFGGYILRITNGGQHLEWDVWDQEFRKQGDSSTVVGSTDWTVVMVHYSPTTVTLFENGVQKFSVPWWTNSPDLTPIFNVQHLDAQTAVSVDISHVRTLSVSKSNLNLIQDLQPALLSYYPLKNNVSDFVVASPTLDLIPTPDFTPSYSPGAFGTAVNFAGATGCLRIPLYPYGRVFPSYTFSLWVNVTSYPSGTDNAGIAGPLSLRPDGRLSYQFVYSNSTEYVTPSVTFVSRNALPLSAWTSVVVTYAYEESRLAIFVGDVLDSIVYTTSDNSSRFAVTPMAGLIGGAVTLSSSSDSAAAPLVVLHGQVSDVMLLKTHVHNRAAAAMATRITVSSGSAGAGADGAQLLAIPGLPSASVDVHPDVLPLVLIIPIVASMVIQVTLAAYIYNTWDTTSTPSGPPIPATGVLQRIVDNIVAVVGKPAVTGRKCSRAQAGIPDAFPITLDVGGEGVLWNGFVCGFPDAINVNDHDLQSNPDSRYPEMGLQPIPYLVKVARWDTSIPPTTLPFEDNFADRMCMQNAPLTETNVTEFARVIKPGGVIDLWIDGELLAEEIDRLAQLLNSQVTFPTGVNYFSGNYTIEVPAYASPYEFASDIRDVPNVGELGYYKHRQIKSRK
ncbi:hypothetical protein B0T21DRAFT_296161 [Apiosordaria backusii]|uniref:Uncharacterized protein n=1 Tax=Apiosordaria backusii TaxID=314023 RepID=A0AA40AIU6_9PEZI|nr:hypothetical protein B0T21DRAFT_296161 [Apiosordaria backusii]